MTKSSDTDSDRVMLWVVGVDGEGRALARLICQDVFHPTDTWSHVPSYRDDDYDSGVSGCLVTATIADIKSFGLDEDGLRQSMRENLELEFGQGQLLDAIVRGAIYEALPTP